MADAEQASDASLVVAIGRWHEQALAEVYRRHGGAVHSLARRILRADPPAEEITQEVFLDLWNHPEKFDAQRGTLRSFLLARTHGKSVDFVRSEVSRRNREERTSRDTATAGYDIDREVWDMAVAEQVQDALGALPDELRQPIELAYFGGHTYREVAQMLQQPEGTVKSRIRSGLSRLRVNLAERGVQPAGAEPVSEDPPVPDHRAIQELLGVYALDAVDPETAAMVERHLAECVKCSIEVAQHHEVAGLLANSGGESPAELWDGIATRLDGSAPPSWDRLVSRLEPGDGRADRLVGPAGGDTGPDATVVPLSAGRRHRWVQRGAVLVAAAAAVVAVVLGVQVGHLHHQVSALQSGPSLSAAEQAALGLPSTRQVLLTSRRIVRSGPGHRGADGVGHGLRRGPSAPSAAGGEDLPAVGGRSAAGPSRSGCSVPIPAWSPSAWPETGRCRPSPSPTSTPAAWSRAPTRRWWPAR